MYFVGQTDRNSQIAAHGQFSSYSHRECWFFIDKILSVVLCHTTGDILHTGLIYTSPTRSQNFHSLSMEYCNIGITVCHALLPQTSA